MTLPDQQDENQKSSPDHSDYSAPTVEQSGKIQNIIRMS